jgi:hypothetical protein
MSFPPPDYLNRILKKRPPMKPILQSMTIWGVLISLIARFAKIEISGDEAGGILSQATAAWPALVGVFADVTAAAKRIGATKFNLDFWRSPVFWSALVAGIMGVLQSVGVDWSGLETLPDKIGGAVATIGGILGPIIMLIGRAKAKKQIGIGGAVGIANVPTSIPWWVVVILKAFPWDLLLKYVLERLKINPDLFAKARQLVLMAAPQPVTGAEKSLAVYDKLERAVPEAKPHEREAAVGLAVASLRLENKV